MCHLHTFICNSFKELDRGTYMILFYLDNRINVAFTVTMVLFLIVLHGVDVSYSLTWG